MPLTLCASWDSLPTPRQGLCQRCDEQDVRGSILDGKNPHGRMDLTLLMFPWSMGPCPSRPGREGNSRHMVRNDIENALSSKLTTTPCSSITTVSGGGNPLPFVACARKSRESLWAPVVSTRQGGYRDRG